MPADIINLRQARKVKARDSKDKRATQNRAKFGRSKSDTEIARLESARHTRSIDGAKLEKSADDMASHTINGDRNSDA